MRTDISNPEDFGFIQAHQVHESRCVIFGVENQASFRVYVTRKNVVAKAKEIADLKNEYAVYANEADPSLVYYNFLKFLWIKFPDGSERRLMDVAEDE